MALARRIILAAGHGGGDSGSVARGTTEAAQAIDIVNKTFDKLKRDGRVAVVVVPHELNLKASIDWINKLFRNIDDGVAIEVHKNCCGGTGIETWVGEAASSQKLGLILHKGIVAVTGMPDRGIKNHLTNRLGRLGWIADTNTWAFLAEMGFIDRDHLNNDIYAQALYEGCLALFDLRPTARQEPERPPGPVAKPIINFRVKDYTGKQLGAYTQELNAWNKYLSVSGQARIFDAMGNDVTAPIVAKFRPAPQPSPQPEPQPKTGSDLIVINRSAWARLFDIIKSWVARLGGGE